MSKKIYSDDLKREILSRDSGEGSISDNYDRSVKMGYQGSLEAFYKYLTYLRKNEATIIDESLTKEEKFLNLLKKDKSIKMFDACNLFNCSPNKVKKIISYCRDLGYEVLADEHRVTLSTDLVAEPTSVKPIGTTEVAFGVMSDPHFGSKAIQLTALNEFCYKCQKKGIKHILVPGDITAGFNVYPGQIHDLYATSADEQIESVIANLPTGFEWYAIGGNHDHSFIKRGGGFNILLSIENKRKDFHCLGFDSGEITILNNTIAKLWHPSKGVPYSLSYRIQKGIEQLAFSELQKISRSQEIQPLVRFVFAGHLHTQFQALFGSIMGVQSGTFEGTTNYLRRLGLVPAVGGWTFRVSLEKNGGSFKEFEPIWHPSQEIEDDWMNFSHTVNRNGIFDNKKPLFEDKF